jgi:hypothetical protein
VSLSIAGVTSAPWFKFLPQVLATARRSSHFSFGTYTVATPKPAVYKVSVMAPRVRAFVASRNAPVNARLRHFVARSRGMEVSDEIWEAAEQDEYVEPELAFPTDILPTEQVRSLDHHARARPAQLWERVWHRLLCWAYMMMIFHGLQCLRALVDSVHSDAVSYFKSFYSSVLGGITTHQSFMSIPVDDHMVHRGHAVFDTAIVAGGHIYQLEQHLDRLLESASRVRITPPEHRSQLRRRILDTAAASKCQSGAQAHHKQHCQAPVTPPIAAKARCC